MNMPARNETVLRGGGICIKRRQTCVVSTYGEVTQRVKIYNCIKYVCMYELLFCLNVKAVVLLNQFHDDSKGR